MVRLIDDAQETIRVAAYSFTSQPVALALLDAHKRGVDVKVVLDKSNKKAKYTSANFLANVGIPTRLDFEYPIMHNKFIIVNGKNVELGSFNYTKAAQEHNAENLIIIRNQQHISLQYDEIWQRLWDESNDMTSNY